MGLSKEQKDPFINLMSRMTISDAKEMHSRIKEELNLSVPLGAELEVKEEF